MLYYDTTNWRKHLTLVAATLAVMLAVLLATSLLLPRGGAGAGQATGLEPGTEVDSTEPGTRIEPGSADPGAPAEPVEFELVAAAPAAPQEPVPVPFEPADAVAFDPDSPCAQAAPSAKRSVQPASVVLLGGRTQGSVEIRNCDSGSVDWSAATEAWVTLADSHGQLPSGASFRLVFTVQTMSLPAGAYAFQLEINRPGHTAVVDVSGTKLGGFLAPGAAPPPEPVIGGLIDPGHAGCATQCITRAWLTTKPGGADVSLEVTTHTPATITAQTGLEPPKYGATGAPFFSSPATTATSDAPKPNWVTTLGPLQPATTYHIIVTAKDAGGVSYRTGSFTTVKAPGGFADQAPAGCSSNCVKRAVLTPIADGFDAEVSVEAHVPLKLQVYVDGVTAATSDGKFLTDWSATLNLEPGKDYQVKLKVTDERGNSQEHQAQFSTPKPVYSHQNRVRVTFHKIWVIDDADNTFFNRRGELTFRFEVDGEWQRHLDTGERKVKAPAWVSLEQNGRGGRSVVIENAPDLLQIRIQAQERDNTQRGFCSAGYGMFEETSGRTLIPDCFELEWNTAEGPIDLHRDTEGQALPECYGFPSGISGDRCVMLMATGDDPIFDVYITIDFLDD